MLSKMGKSTLLSLIERVCSLLIEINTIPDEQKQCSNGAGSESDGDDDDDDDDDNDYDDDEDDDGDDGGEI